MESELETPGTERARDLFLYLTRRVASGYRPTANEAAAWTLHHAGEAPRGRGDLWALVSRGWARLDPLAGDFVEIGPFTFEDSDWSVLIGETPVHARGALDALAIHHVSGEDVSIRSHCGTCSREITILIKYGRIRSAVPPGVRLFVPEDRSSETPSPFFCSAEDFFLWRESLRIKTGTALTLEEGLIYAEGLFPAIAPEKKAR